MKTLIKQSARNLNVVKYCIGCWA